MADLSHLSVKERVDQMIAGARARFGCIVSINQSKRSAEQAQQFHVCHMFLHNFFKKLKPKFVAGDGRTIQWEHLSDPGIAWALIPNPEQSFLFTKIGRPAKRELVGGRARWALGWEPDKDATTRAMTSFLARAHVTSMAAPGIDHCGEPCCCGGHASKHISGGACDVSGMAILGQHVLRETRGLSSAEDAVDHFLAEYHLFRPMAHLPGKAREAWHLEALPAHHARGHARHASHRGKRAHDPQLHLNLHVERMEHRHGC